MNIGSRPAGAGPRRGDIHLLTSRDVGGNVLSWPHPAVVVQTDRMAGSSTVLFVPMTSAPRSAALRPPYLVPVAGRESGLARDGWVKADQVFMFPAAELGERAGRLAADRLEDLDAALRFVLNL